MATTLLPDALPNDIRLMNTTAAVLGAAGAILLAAIALLWLAHRPFFALRSITVDGDLAHNNVLTIRANAAPKLAGNFFTMDLAAGRRAFEAVPWVRQAVVHRVWPNRLDVQLQEHRAVALWSGVASNVTGSTDGNSESSASSSDDAADRLVNSFGEVFEANLGDVEDEALPTLHGPEGSSVHLLAMLARLEPVLGRMNARIDTLGLSGRGSWHVALDTGAELELGRGSDDEVVARTETFVATLPAVKSFYPGPLQHADLRHNQGFAVRIKGTTTSVDAASKTQKK